MVWLRDHCVSLVDFLLCLPFLFSICCNVEPVILEITRVWAGWAEFLPLHEDTHMRERERENVFAVS